MPTGPRQTRPLSRWARVSSPRGPSKRAQCRLASPPHRSLGRALLPSPPPLKQPPPPAPVWVPTPCSLPLPMEGGATLRGALGTLAGSPSFLPFAHRLPAAHAGKRPPAKPRPLWRKPAGPRRTRPVSCPLTQSSSTRVLLLSPSTPPAPPSSPSVSPLGRSGFILPELQRRGTPSVPSLLLLPLRSSTPPGTPAQSSAFYGYTSRLTNPREPSPCYP
jgi:hypothetical protein